MREVNHIEIIRVHQSHFPLNILDYFLIMGTQRIKFRGTSIFIFKISIFNFTGVIYVHFFTLFKGYGNSCPPLFLSVSAHVIDVLYMTY